MSRQLRPLVQSMTTEAARTVAAAFISCRLDHCNSLLYIYGLPDTLLRKLQSVQNATARQSLAADAATILRQFYVTPLAAHSVACQVQTGMSGSPNFASRCSATNTQQLRRQNIYGRRSSSVEFFPGPAAQSRHYLRTV